MVVTTAAVGVTFVALALLVPSTSGTGSEMDEGAVVAYAARVLDGALPHRDFLTFYGPGNLWLVAGAFAVAGESVATERVVGLAYRLVIVFSLFVLAWRLGGVLGGTLAAVVGATIMSTELVWAYATYGAIAFGVLTLALAALAAESAERRRPLLYLGAGIAAGMAVLMRFELAPSVLVSTIPLLMLASARARWWFVGGLVGPAGLCVLHLALVGPDRLDRLLGDLVATRPGRSFPLPDPSTWNARLLAAGVALSIAYVVVGALLWRSRASAAAPRILVAYGLFTLGLLPSVLFRPDAAHIRPFAMLAISLLPGAILLFTRLHRGSTSRLRVAIAIAVSLAVVFPVLAEARHSAQALREGRGISTGTYDFYTDEREAGGRAVVARTSALARPGELLFVGPQDLRRTNYGPTFMYFLLQQLRPASYYMEMNPGTANREGSGLADDLREADWLILTTAWDDWNEPNTSSEYGSSEPNEVVRDDFCLRFEREPFRLYGRCDR